MTGTTGQIDPHHLDPNNHSIEFGRLAVGIYFPVFLRVFGAAMCGTYVPLYAKQLGASNAEIGLVAGATATGLLIADLPAGIFVSRLGTRRSMVLGISGMALAFAFATQARGIASLGAFLLLAGFCMALVQISQLTILRHAMPDHVRGRGMSLVGGTVRLAGILAPVAGGMLFEAAGCRALFGSYSLLLVGACILFLWRGPKRQIPAAPNGTHVADMCRMGRERWRTLLPAGGIMLVLGILRQARRILLPLWGYALGFSPTTIGVIVSIGATADTLFFPLGGLVSDKKGRRWSLTGSMGLFSLGLIAMAAIGNSFMGLVAIAIIIGIGNGLGSGINMTVGTDLAPHGKGASQFLGLWRVVTDTGGAAGPPIVGMLSQFMALGPAAVTVGFVGIGAVALMWRIMPEPAKLRSLRK